MKREVSLDALEKPLLYSPDWFKISSSMSDCFSDCRQKFLLSYIYKIKPRKIDHKLLRRSCVIFASNESIKFGDASNTQRVGYFLLSEAKKILMDGLIDHSSRSWMDWEEYCNTNNANPVYEALRVSYDFPSPEDKRWYFTFDDFMVQCINATATIRQFIERNGIVPLKKDGRLFVQQTLEAPLIIDGEVLDVTNEKPTVMRAQVNYIDSDMNVYMWRISSKRSSAKDMVAHISESIDAQAAVIAHHFNGDIKFPIRFDLRKIVVEKRGDISEVESHKRDVSKQEVLDVKRRLAHKAQQIKTVNLFQERSWRCPMCEYYDVCIKKNASNFIQEFWGDDPMPTVVKKSEDDDDMPW